MDVGILSQCIGISNHDVHFKYPTILCQLHLNKAEIKKGIIDKVNLKLHVHSGSGECRNWHMPIC